jgi:hypothetical protein
MENTIAIGRVAGQNPVNVGIRIVCPVGSPFFKASESKKLKDVYTAYTTTPPDGCLAREKKHEPIVAIAQRDPETSFLAVASRVYHRVCDTCPLSGSCNLVEKKLARVYPEP